MAALMDDFNIPLALSRLQALASEANKGAEDAGLQLASCADLLHLLRDENWFKTGDVTGWIKQKSKQLLRQRNLPVR